MMKLLFQLLLSLYVLNIFVQGQTVVEYFVDSQTTYTGGDCGASSANACQDLSKLITFISGDSGLLEDNIIVLIAPGEYSNQTLPINLYGFQNISIQSNTPSDIVTFNGISDTNTTSLFVIADPVNSTDTITTRVKLSNIQFINTRAPGNGGIFNIVLSSNTTVTLDIISCKFSNNTLPSKSANTTYFGSGSVIYFETGENNTVNSNFTINESTFEYSNALNSIIYINSSQVDGSIYGSTFSHNKAYFAAVVYTESSLIVSGSEFKNNSATQESGAIYIYRSTSGNNLIEDSTFTDHLAGNGGAVSIYDSYLQVIGSDFLNNIANVRGAGIYVSGDDSFILINGSTFLNGFSGSGGGVCLETNVVFSIVNCQFQNNTAYAGGSLYLYYAVGDVINTPILSSTALEQGGAIYTASSKLTLLDSRISNNTAGSGGSIYCSDSKVKITNTLISGNKDTLNITQQEGGEIVKNGDNIFCSLDPSYTFCVFSGDLKYTKYCGEQVITIKSGLSKGQVAGIVIGSVVGAAILAFGCAYVLLSKFSLKSYFTALKDSISHEDLDDHVVN